MRILAILVGAACLMAQAPEPLSPEAAGVFAIWPGTAPGSENWTWHEQTDNRAGLVTFGWLIASDCAPLVIDPCRATASNTRRWLS